MPKQRWTLTPTERCLKASGLKFHHFNDVHAHCILSRQPMPAIAICPSVILHSLFVQVYVLELEERRPYG